MNLKSWAATLSFLMCSTAVASASPCATETLADYIALGSAGCTVGPKLLFDNFSFVVLDSSGGAMAVTPNQITVTPEVTPGSPYGLNYASTGFKVTAGQSIQYLLSYTISDPPPIIRGFYLHLFTDPPIFPGLVDISSKECLGAAFSSGMCSGTPLTQDVFTNGHISSLTSFRTFSQIDVLGDETTITLDASKGGTASFTSFTESGVVPEPRSALLVGAGLATVLIAITRRKAKHS